MPGLIKALIISLVLTEAFEMPFCTVAWRFGGRDLAVCALVNVVTNPPVVLLYTMTRLQLTAVDRVAYMPLAVAVLEFAAVLVEWLFYRRCTDKKHPFLISLTANAFSYGLGLVVTSLL